MNKVTLMGRATRDVDLAYSKGKEPLAIARVTMAVNRHFDREKADFISIVAFGKTAELMGDYIHKGDRFCISGRIQTGSYENKDGVTIYTTEVVVEELEFAQDKKEEGNRSKRGGRR